MIREASTFDMKVLSRHEMRVQSNSNNLAPRDGPNDLDRGKRGSLDDRQLIKFEGGFPNSSAVGRMRPQSGQKTFFNHLARLADEVCCDHPQCCRSPNPTNTVMN